MSSYSGKDSSSSSSKNQSNSSFFAPSSTPLDYVYLVEVVDKAITTVIAGLRADPKAPIGNTLMKAITSPLPDEYSTFILMWAQEKAHGISKILKKEPDDHVIAALLVHLLNFYKSKNPLAIPFAAPGSTYIPPSTEAPPPSSSDKKSSSSDKKSSSSDKKSSKSSKSSQKEKSKKHGDDLLLQGQTELSLQIKPSRLDFNRPPTKVGKHKTKDRSSKTKASSSDLSLPVPAGSEFLASNRRDGLFATDPSEEVAPVDDNPENARTTIELMRQLHQKQRMMRMNSKTSLSAEVNATYDTYQNTQEEEHKEVRRKHAEPQNEYTYEAKREEVKPPEDYHPALPKSLPPPLPKRPPVPPQKPALPPEEPPYKPEPKPTPQQEVVDKEDDYPDYTPQLPAEEPSSIRAHQEEEYKPRTESRYTESSLSASEQRQHSIRFAGSSNSASSSRPSEYSTPAVPASHAYTEKPKPQQDDSSDDSSSDSDEKPRVPLRLNFHNRETVRPQEESDEEIQVESPPPPPSDDDSDDSSSNSPAPVQQSKPEIPTSSSASSYASKPAQPATTNFAALLAQRAAARQAHKTTAQPVQSGPLTAKEDPRFKKYFDKLAQGMNRNMVNMFMRNDGLDPSILDKPDEVIP